MSGPPELSDATDTTSASASVTLTNAPMNKTQRLIFNFNSEAKEIRRPWEPTTKCISGMSASLTTYSDKSSKVDVTSREIVRTALQDICHKSREDLERTILKYFNKYFLQSINAGSVEVRTNFMAEYRSMKSEAQDMVKEWQKLVEDHGIKVPEILQDTE